MSALDFTNPVRPTSSIRNRRSNYGYSGRSVRFLGRNCVLGLLCAASLRMWLSSARCRVPIQVAAMARQYGREKIDLWLALSLIAGGEGQRYGGLVSDLRSGFGCSERAAKDAVALLSDAKLSRRGGDRIGLREQARWGQVASSVR